MEKRRDEGVILWVGKFTLKPVKLLDYRGKILAIFKLKPIDLFGHIVTA